VAFRLRRPDYLNSPHVRIDFQSMGSQSIPSYPGGTAFIHGAERNGILRRYSILDEDIGSRSNAMRMVSISGAAAAACASF
jgi:hypothetical protein